MKILYDVATMAQLTAACQSANDELQKAQSLVMEVQSHSDWTCKEKDTIDDLMRECKKRIQELCESEKNFLGAVRLAAEDLTDAEKNVSALFGGVESLLGKILAIPVKTVTVSGQSMLERIGFGMPDANAGLNNWAKGVGEAVRIGLDELHREQIIQKYDPQFSGSGTLYWPEAEVPPDISAFFDKIQVVSCSDLTI